MARRPLAMRFLGPGAGWPLRLPDSFGALDDDALFAGALPDGRSEAVGPVGDDLEAGFGVEDADRSDLALGDVAGLAYQRQQPARFGAVFPAKRYAEPDAILEARVGTFALRCVENRRRAFGKLFGGGPRGKLLAHEGHRDLLGGVGSEEFACKAGFVFAGRLGQGRIGQDALVV